jgi:hypothetical protein
MTKEEQRHFDSLEDIRAKRGLLPDQRWLTTDDIWQEGDEYCGNPPEWWRIGHSPETGVPAGSLIDIGMLCYTPRGKR